MFSVLSQNTFHTQFYQLANKASSCHNSSNQTSVFDMRKIGDSPKHGTPRNVSQSTHTDSSFDKHAKLATLALLGILHCRIYIWSFFFIQQLMLVYFKLEIKGVYDDALLGFLMFNGRVKTKLTMLVFLYCGEIVKNSITCGVQLGWRTEITYAYGHTPVNRGGDWTGHWYNLTSSHVNCKISYFTIFEQLTVLWGTQ